MRLRPYSAKDILFVFVAALEDAPPPSVITPAGLNANGPEAPAALMNCALAAAAFASSTTEAMRAFAGERWVLAIGFFPIQKDS